MIATAMVSNVMMILLKERVCSKNVATEVDESENVFLKNLHFFSIKPKFVTL